MKTILVGINAKYIHPNLAIRYLYTYTKDSHDVEFLEFTIKEAQDEIIAKILNFQPDLVGFSCYIWNIEIIKSIINKIKAVKTDVRILLGGPEASFDIHHWFSALPIDFIISGEGEYPFKKLLEALEANQELSAVPQLHYLSDTEIRSNKKEYFVDLNTLPSPYRLEIDNPNRKQRIQYIESSRGCPFRCSYCLASLEKKVRYFNSEFVKQEILYLMERGGKTFKFLDRTFNLRRDYALEIFEFIIKHHKKGCVFQFEITGELLDQDIITYLNTYAPKGLIRFEIGVQSTNDETNRLVDRHQNFVKLKKNIELIQEGQKIDLHLDLIAGLPKEDFNSFTKTFNDVYSLQPQELQLGFLKMLRGTKLRNQAEVYKYKYLEKAPYEIIENDVLKANEIKWIHQAEDILEKYYNSHRFEGTLPYLINKYYADNPFLFFGEFGAFYSQNYTRISHQLADLWVRLLAFLNAKKYDTEEIASLLKYDYLKNAKTKPKIYYQSLITGEERQELYKHFIKTHPEYNLDILNRYSLAEKLYINPVTYETGTYYLIKLFSPQYQDIFIVSMEK